MDANDLINSTLNTGAKMIGGDNLFVIEGNSERNELRRETAEEQIEVIRKFFRNEQGEVVL